MTHALRTDAVAPRAEIAERRLRQVFRANVLTSAVSGIVMAIAPGTVDELLGTGHSGWVRLVGLALLPFAAFVAWLSTADLRQLQLHTPGIVAGDVAWVVASVATIAFGWYSSGGNVAVGAMALAVDVFAGLQLMFWNRIRS